VQDAVGEATDQAQEIVEGAGQQVQDAAGQATDQIEESAQQVAATEDQAAGDAGDTNGTSQTTQRAVDQTGDIIEITLNEHGEIVGEELVGNVGSLPTEEEYVDEEGRVVRRVKDEAGNRIEQVFNDEGKTVGIRVV